jgi:hypothetical protein
MMSGVLLKTCLAFNERWNNKFYYKVASGWLFLLSYTTMHGSINIKLKKKRTLFIYANITCVCVSVCLSVCTAAKPLQLPSVLDVI